MKYYQVSPDPPSREVYGCRAVKKNCASVAHHSTPVQSYLHSHPVQFSAGLETSALSTQVIQFNRLYLLSLLLLVCFRTVGLFDECHCVFYSSGGINTAVKCVAVSSVLRSPATNAAAMATRPTERAAACASAEVSSPCYRSCAPFQFTGLVSCDKIFEEAVDLSVGILRCLRQPSDLSPEANTEVT